MDTTTSGIPWECDPVTKELTMTMSHSNRSGRCHTSHLGLLSLLLCEDEESIPGQEAGNEDIQEGNIFPAEIHWFQHKHTAPYTEKEDKYFKTIQPSCKVPFSPGSAALCSFPVLLALGIFFLMPPPGFLCAQCTSMTICIGSYSVCDPFYWFLFCGKQS